MDLTPSQGFSPWNNPTPGIPLCCCVEVVSLTSRTILLIGVFYDGCEQVYDTIDVVQPCLDTSGFPFLGETG